MTVRLAPSSLSFVSVAWIALSFSGSAWAQGGAGPEPAPDGAEATSTAAPDLSAPLSLGVSLSGYGLEPRELREAVAEELGREVVPATRTGEAGGWASIVATRGEELVVTVGRGADTGVSRRVRAPATDAELLEVSSLLVGNLARDESASLLSELRGEREPAATTPEDAPAPAIVNLSLLHPAASLPDADQRDVALELGLLYGRVGELSGFALSMAGVVHVLGDARYLQVAPIGWIDAATAAGLRVGGVLGIGGGDFSGVSLAGALQVTDGSLGGAQLSGAANVHGGRVDGVQVSGAANVAGDVRGVQVAGAANVAGDVRGVQVAGAANVARDVDGVQFSLVNVGGSVHGLQAGLINVGGEVRGAQLGLINVAREVEGASIGLVTYSQKGRTQAVSWYGSLQPVNVGIRFVSGPLYAMPTFGYSPNDVTKYAPGFSLGARFPFRGFFGDLDVNYSNPTDGSAYDEHAVDLRYRALVGYEITDWLGVFAGGGVRHHFRTQGDRQESVDPEATLGVQLL